MSSKEELERLRREIDGIDGELVALFGKRMKAAKEIGWVKTKGNMAIFDNDREQKILERALAATDEEMKAETVAFMRTLMALSKMQQAKNVNMASPADFPAAAAKKTENVKVAYQGVPGAWSQQGAARLFPQAELCQCEYFEDVFNAVKAGAADYGVLPIENSRTGAIGEVYDLLKKHSCYIVGEIWITIAQCLLAIPGAELADIREVFSHPEGFGQCRRFLKGKNWDLTACRNTAVAAQMAAEKNSPKYGAIGSRQAAQAYGLNVLAPDIMDSAGNKTRFIVIAGQPIYDESSGVTSITFSTAHKSGALCAVLESFMLGGLNLTRIESRPVSQDHYRFFADLQANILSETTRDALSQAATQCDYFEILGCYSTTEE
jgi:chorismate mutase/prephenate dehydratase